MAGSEVFRNYGASASHSAESLLPTPPPPATSSRKRQRAIESVNEQTPSGLAGLEAIEDANWQPGFLWSQENGDVFVQLVLDPPGHQQKRHRGQVQDDILNEW